MTIPEIQDIGSLLYAVDSLIMIGILFSGTFFILINLKNWLADYFDRVNKTDPVAFIRMWDKFFNKEFLPYGKAVVDEQKSRRRNQVFFQVFIGIVGIAFAMSIYLIFTVSALFGGIVTYYTAGTVPNMDGLPELIAAFAILLSISINSYAGMKSVEHV